MCCLKTTSLSVAKVGLGFTVLKCDDDTNNYKLSNLKIDLFGSVLLQN